MVTDRFDKESDKRMSPARLEQTGETPAAPARYGYPRDTDAVAERLRKKLGVRRAISAWMKRRDS